MAEQEFERMFAVIVVSEKQTGIVDVCKTYPDALKKKESLEKNENYKSYDVYTQTVWIPQ